MKALTIAGLATLLLGGAASAQQAAPERVGDADPDISRATFLARQLERFDRGDRDRDGVLTATEAQAAVAARRAEMRERMFQRLDADGDGAVSRAEFDAADTAREARRSGHGFRRHVRRGRAAFVELAADGLTREEVEARAEALFARLDADGDGHLSRADREARRAAREAE